MAACLPRFSRTFTVALLAGFAAITGAQAATIAGSYTYREGAMRPVRVQATMSALPSFANPKSIEFDSSQGSIQHTSLYTFHAGGKFSLVVTDGTGVNVYHGTYLSRPLGRVGTNLILTLRANRTVARGAIRAQSHGASALVTVRSSQNRLLYTERFAGRS